MYSFLFIILKCPPNNLVHCIYFFPLSNRCAFSLHDGNASTSEKCLRNSQYCLFNLLSNNCVLLTWNEKEVSPWIIMLGQKCQSISPVIPTRACSIFEMMELIMISYSNLSFIDNWNIFSVCVTVITHPEVSSYPYGRSLRCMYKCKSNC